jgi:hypothetical protein
MPDGRPDLSGVMADASNRHVVDIIQDVKDEAVFKPAAETTFQKRFTGKGRDWPPSRCLPTGPGEMFSGLHRINQSLTVVALLYNGAEGDGYRPIFLDGRALPKDANLTWRGYSVGRWEGDTLVAETAGFNDRTWLDAPRPISIQCRGS